jgi:GNAT superfamily N-acetyltransferase
MATKAPPIEEGTLVIRPANEVDWEDLEKVLAATAPANCQCQRYKMNPGECLVSFPREERADRLRRQTDPGRPEAEGTTGLLAYLDDEPIGWCAVEPRPAYISLVRGGRVAWTGRSEDRHDPDVWAVMCFVTRAGYRKRGVARMLARAAVDYAREHGAKAVEGYPVSVGGGAMPDELHVGTEGMFADAGLHPVTRPSNRRVVMRIDF